eukprot:UN21490
MNYYLDSNDDCFTRKIFNIFGKLSCVTMTHTCGKVQEKTSPLKLLQTQVSLQFDCVVTFTKYEEEFTKPKRKELYYNISGKRK